MSPRSELLRQLGKDGPELPAIGFGLMNLAGVYGEPPSDSDAFGILDRALELGMVFWDTAE
jgi:aryl-alcohol dehydrogenase-like predicted oxidoreductase